MHKAEDQSTDAQRIYDRVLPLNNREDLNSLAELQWMIDASVAACNGKKFSEARKLLHEVLNHKSIFRHPYLELWSMALLAYIEQDSSQDPSPGSPAKAWLERIIDRWRRLDIRWKAKTTHWYYNAVSLLEDEFTLALEKKGALYKEAVSVYEEFPCDSSPFCSDVIRQRGIWA
ncbi:hypothetical protein K469DRAFT_301519 [Zopfia rhizophila CBS 207.26]|uniref:Uncharacterized protein n=1 Tax=Zopfia rhizophila CBS 207.26 TaxID=1314779 RepID=A0A6A6DN29_9PEZI|nr:hypothetical protein K469DRAFT_301519 [Zopfia rhizophila CBS 207.26]